MEELKNVFVCKNFMEDLFLYRKLTKEDVENKLLVFYFPDFLDILTDYNVAFRVDAYKTQYPIYRCNMDGTGEFITKHYNSSFFYKLMDDAFSVKRASGSFTEELNGKYFISCHLNCYLNFYMFTEQILEQAVKISKENPELKFDVKIITPPNTSKDYFEYHDTVFKKIVKGSAKNPLTLEEKYKEVKNFIENNIGVWSPKLDYGALNIH